MRVPFRRLLVVGGGAVVLATAGFAYMASNTVPNTSAGTGLAAVSGYTVTNVTFNNETESACGYGYAGVNGDVNAGCELNTMQFTLTSNDGTSQNCGAPDVLYVDLINDTLSASSDQVDNASLSGPAIAAAETTPALTCSGTTPWAATFSINFGNGTGVGQVTNYSITATQ